MDWRRYVRTHLPPLDIRAEREAEIREELAQQLEEVCAAAQASGRSVDEAIARACAEIQDWQHLAASLCDIESRPRFQHPPLASPSRGAVMYGFLLDLRRAAHRLLYSPTYASIAIVMLALGLGLGTATFSLVDRILLQPLPYASPSRLVLLKATVPPEGRETAEITYPDALDLMASDVFATAAALITFAGTTTTTDPPSRLEGFEVSPSLFDTLGMTAALGRTFTAQDGDASSPPVAMIGFGLWRRLGSPADIVGRVLMINEVPRTVVGVVRADFRVDLMDYPADVFLPLTPDHPFAANRGIRAFRVIARLENHVSLEQATAATATIGARLEKDYPLTNQGRTFALRSLQDEIVGPVQSQLWLVAGLVVLVLLVAAVNLAGLLLTRTVGQMRDITVRLALGASRWRLAREWIAEGLVISMFGGIAGGLLAGAAVDVVRIAPGLQLPRLGEIALDVRALAALSIAAVLVACGAGLVPLFLTGRFAPTTALRTGHETASRPAIRLRSLLIVGQTSFVFVLLAAAVLLATSLRAVLAQPLGFEAHDVVTMRVAVPESRYTTRDDTVSFYAEVLDTLRLHPAVRSAGVVSVLPLAGNTGSTLTIQGREETPPALRPTIGWHWASPGYFAAMGIPIIRGRDFRSDDIRRSQHVTVINAAMARLHFAGEDPIGKRVYFGGFGPDGPPEWHEIIGIVGDIRHRQLDAEPDARAYDLFGQHWGRTISLAVRTSDTPLQVAGLVRSVLAERDPRLAVFSIRTTADLVTNAVATRRVLLWVVGVLATVGLVVSLIGLYGTVAYMVAQRTREVGVRLALGATSRQIWRLVMRRGLQLVAAGIVIGLVATLVFARAIEAQLFGIPSANAPALASAAAVLIIAAAAACTAPALRATRVNPVDSLRAE
jgi:predicted permease